MATATEPFAPIAPPRHQPDCVDAAHEESPRAEPAAEGLSTWRDRALRAQLRLIAHPLLWRRAFIALALLSFGATAAVYLMSLTGNLSVEGDNAIYIILAKALATGHGYTNIQDPSPRIEAQFPFMFPLLLAPVVRIWGTAGVLQMQALVAACTLASFAALFALFRRWLDSAPLAYAIVVAVAASDLTWSFSHKVLTELPYLLFTVLACLFATRYAAEERWRTWSGALAALATSAAFLTRTIGLSLCVALPLFLLLAPPVRLRDPEGWRLRLRKVAWAGLFIVVLAGGWTLRNRIVYSGHGRNYLEQFQLKQTYVPDAGRIGIDPAFLLGRAGAAIQYYGGVYQRMLAGHIWDHVPARGGLSQALLLITALGFVHALIRRRTVAEFYLTGYVAIVLVWPWTDLRFVVPILPFLIYYFALALLPLGTLLARFRPVDPCAAVAMALLPLAAPTAIHTYHTAVHDRAVGYHYESERLGEWPAYSDWRDFHAAAIWLKQNAVPGATVINRSPNIFYLWTGLYSRNYPYSYDGRYVLGDIGKERNDYVIDDRFQWTYTTASYLDPVIRLYRDHFFGPFPVRDAHGTAIYQVVNP